MSAAAKPTMEPLVYTAAEVAELLGVRRETVYTMVGRGEIPCRRLGTRILFGRQAITAWANKIAINDDEPKPKRKK